MCRARDVGARLARPPSDTGVRRCGRRALRTSRHTAAARGTLTSTIASEPSSAIGCAMRSPEGRSSTPASDPEWSQLSTTRPDRSRARFRTRRLDGRGARWWRTVGARLASPDALPSTNPSPHALGRGDGGEDGPPSRGSGVSICCSWMICSSQSGRVGCVATRP